MRKILVIVLGLMATGCASFHQFTGPNGKTAYSIECGDLYKCYSKASGICAGGYNVLNLASKTVGVNGIVSTGQEMVFECK